MSATVQNVIDEVRFTIHDENAASYRWTDAELIAYVNAASRQIVTIVPEANIVESIQTISNNIARQSLPVGGIKFVKAVRNVSEADGTTQEGAIRYVEKDVLDGFDPNWEHDTTIKVIAASSDFFEHYTFDPRDPKTYFLYPPASANAFAEIAYSAIPTVVSAVGNTIPLGDEYLTSYNTYVTYRALTKESRDSMPTQYRQELWNNFLSSLGQKVQADLRVAPEQNIPPEAP